MNYSGTFLREAAWVVFGAILLAAGFNLFMIPYQIIIGGISGVAMLIGYVTQWSIGWLYFVLNAPLFIWGWFILGKKFVYFSLLSVVATTSAMFVIPKMQFTQDPIIAAIFGGVLVGLGTGLSLKQGGSTGGFDIIASVLLRRYDFSLGQFLSALNGVVLIFLGLTQRNWEVVLYSIVAIFVTGKMVDAIHTQHLKMTLFIVTTRKEEMLARLRSFPRGVTVMKTEGAYTRTENHMLMIVTTRYELHTLLNAVRDVDPQAFVNMVGTVGVSGLFRRD